MRMTLKFSHDVSSNANDWGEYSNDTYRQDDGNLIHGGGLRQKAMTCRGSGVSLNYCHCGIDSSGQGGGDGGGGDGDDDGTWQLDHWDDLEHNYAKMTRLKGCSHYCYR